MDWGEILTNVAVAFISVLVPVLLGLLLAWARPALKKLDAKLGAELGAEQWALMKALVVQFVEAAEQRQVWDKLLQEGAARKEWVILQLQTSFNGYGINVDWNEIDAAIEQAVLSLDWGIVVDKTEDEVDPYRFTDGLEQASVTITLGEDEAAT